MEEAAMNAPETKSYNLGRPVPFRRPNPAAVLLSHVLLFALIFSPVFGVALGGWAVHEVGKCIGHGVREWRREHREMERERGDGPMVWRAPRTDDRPANERAEAEF
jgi:hypothetical protein